MKKWLAALLAAVLAANYLLVVVAIIGALSAIIVMVRLIAMLG